MLRSDVNHLQTDVANIRAEVEQKVTHQEFERWGKVIIGLQTLILGGVITLAFRG